MKTKLNHFNVLRKLISLVVVMTMLMGVTVTAFAQENHVVRQQEQEVDYDKILKEVEAQKARYEQAVQRMEQHIYLNEDGLLQIDVEKGLVLGIDEALFQELNSALAITNEHIASGKLSLEEIAFSDGTNIFGEVVQQYNDGYVLACAGWTGVTYTWQGPRIYTNHCHTEMIINALVTGGGAAAICALAFAKVPPVNIICGAAVAITAIGAGTIGFINAMGGHQGVYFQLNWAHNSVLYMWHQ